MADRGRIGSDQTATVRQKQQMLLEFKYQILMIYFCDIGRAQFHYRPSGAKGPAGGKPA